MTQTMQIRPIRPEDYAMWKPLWDGYNAFYGRSGPTALPDDITQVTWQRFFNPIEPVRAGRRAGRQADRLALPLPSRHDPD